MYYRASTANPLGVRPWNSRLAGLNFYIPNTFAVPTAGRGQMLLNAGVPCAYPAMNGGLGIDTGNRYWWLQQNRGRMSGSPEANGLGATVNILGVDVDTTMLMIGGGLLAVALLMSRRSKKSRSRRRRQYRAKAQKYLAKASAV